MNRVAVGGVGNITPRQFLAHMGKKEMKGMILKPCDVFINHRGVDTKKTVAALLYDRLVRVRLRPFLDYKNLRPGEKLFDEIHGAIRQCKVGVAVFSPRYCESYFCLHELAMIIESNKKVCYISLLLLLLFFLLELFVVYFISIIFILILRFHMSIDL